MLLRPVGAEEGAPAARLGYCLNLHASESLDDVVHALREYAAAVRDRLGAQGLFGVGMYLGADVAAQLARDGEAFDRLAQTLADERLDPFTFNAFPYGGFQRDGLKQAVYAPAWTEPERLEFTVNVAHVAARLRDALGLGGSHVSISTHPGAYGPEITDRSTLRVCAEQFARAVGECARIEDESGVRVVLAVEAEPDASARNGRALAEFLVFARLIGGRVLGGEAEAWMSRHFGTCLDACHSAVEFEGAAEACGYATHGGPLGKLQYSSALRVSRPAEHPEAVAALLALDEPRFLHQVTANDVPPKSAAFLHLPDLPALREELEGAASPWHDAGEWRCHFHVPVDLPAAGRLQTTRDHADAILRRLLETPGSWGAEELHVEIETYTWNVMPEAVVDGAGGVDVVDGLVREYEHVLGTFAAAGWVVEDQANS